MVKKLISYDDEAEGLGLPDVVEQRIENRLADVESLRITPERTTFFRAPTNLFDKTKITENMVIPSGSADLNPSANFNVSDPIPVTAGRVYSYAGALRVTYIDSSGDYVGHSNLPASFSGTYTAPSGATHVRISVSLHGDSMDTAQMNLGPELLPYEPHRHFVADEYIPIEFYDPHTYDPIIIDDPDGLREFFQGPVIEERPDLYSTDAATVYGWWDDLVARHPDYVTREDLGTACDGVTPMYKYTLKPQSVPTTHTGKVTQEQEHPVLLLVSGVHAYEEQGIFNVWRLAKALCDEWNTHSALRVLRWNFEVVVVPVGNPTGMASTPHTRNNTNGVDIARNFDAGWEALDTSGPHPESEPETRHITQVIEEVAGRTILAVSHHNFGATTDNPWCMIWPAPTTDYTRTLGQKNITRMSTYWRKEHDWITVPETYFGYADHSNRPPGGEGLAFVKHGIQGLVFETSVTLRIDGSDGKAYSTRAMTLGYEAFVNFVAMGLAEGLKIRENTIHF